MKAQLEDIRLELLHVEFRGVPEEERDKSDEIMLESTYSYHTGTHKTDSNRFRFTFGAKFEQISVRKVPIAYLVNSRISAYFVYDSTPPNDEFRRGFKLAAVNVLYGTLRGLILGVTGSFNVGPPLILPLVLPTDIVAGVENAKAEARKKKTKGTSQAGPTPSSSAR